MGALQLSLDVSKAYDGVEREDLRDASSGARVPRHDSGDLDYALTGLASDQSRSQRGSSTSQGAQTRLQFIAHTLGDILRMDLSQT